MDASTSLLFFHLCCLCSFSAVAQASNMRQIITRKEVDKGLLDTRQSNKENWRSENRAINGYPHACVIEISWQCIPYVVWFIFFKKRKKDVQL